MTSRTTDQQQRPQHREDSEVQKLIERVETQMANQSKAIREASQASSKN